MPHVDKLDAKTVAGLTLADDKLEAIFFDRRLPGHGMRLRRQKFGAPVRKTWITQCFTSEGRKPRVTHGLEAKLAPTQAFEASRQVLAKVALGRDPQAEKVSNRRAASKIFHRVVDEYVMARASELRPGSLRLAKLYLRGPYFKLLHPMPVSKVTHADVAECIRITEREHSSHTAAAARRALSTFFGWAIGESLMGPNPVNPVIGTRVPADNPARDRVLSIEELIAVWRACDDDEYGFILRLLILTGARADEIGGMPWSELNLDVGTWELPKERSKNHRSHQIVLPSLARELIQKIMPTMGREQLFGSRGAGFTNWQNAKVKLDQRLGDKVKPWRVHDLRRTTATHMAELGIQPHIVEACLNHYSGHRRGIRQVYNRALRPGRDRRSGALGEAY